MKRLSVLGWILFASAAIHYLAGLFSGEFTQRVSGLLCYGTSMKSFWLTVISGTSLLLSIIIMLLVCAIKKCKRNKSYLPKE